MQKQGWKRATFVLGTLLCALIWYGFLDMASRSRQHYDIIAQTKRLPQIPGEPEMVDTTPYAAVVTDPTTFLRIEKSNSKTVTTVHHKNGLSNSFFDSKPLSKKMCVVLNAGFRTGSSFAGEFFNKHADFMYLFEPLQNFQLPKLMPSTKTVTDVLGKLFTCQATGSFLGGLTHRVGWTRAIIFGLYSNQSKYNNHLSVRDRSKKFDVIYPKLCRMRPYHAAKVIRVHNITFLEPLMRKGVKVLTLVRDPRGTYWSRKVYKTYGSSREEDIKAYCEEKYHDVLRYKNLYKIHGRDILNAMDFVRYEDLATSPNLSMLKLYNFMGIDPDEDVRQWVQENQDRNEVDGNSSNVTYSKTQRGSSLGRGETRMGTFRQRPALTAVSWRETMPMNHVRIVQKHCSDFMAEFGYIQFHNEKNLRNFDIQSFSAIDLLGEGGAN